jgi:hypothetical protein
MSSFLRGYIAVNSSIAARESIKIRKLLQAQGQREEAKQQQEIWIANLRNDLFQFAKVLRNFLTSPPENRNWAAAVFEAQRFINWDRINPSVQNFLPSFEDKGFLEQTRQAARIKLRGDVS